MRRIVLRGIALSCAASCMAALGTGLSIPRWLQRKVRLSIYWLATTPHQAPMTGRKASLLYALLLAAVPIPTSGLLAATLIVANVGDHGPGSLRDAIDLASPGDAIQFDASLAGVPIVLTTGELRIDKDITITGLGEDRTILDANHSGRVIRIGASAVVMLSGMTIMNGFPHEIVPGPDQDNVVAEGGGIYSAGSLTLDDVSVQNNAVDGRICEAGFCRWRGISIKGGGIYNIGTLDMNRGAVTGNSADMESLNVTQGGGIYNGGRATLVGTSVSGNTGASDKWIGVQGVGFFNDVGSSATLVDSTVAGNSVSASLAIHNHGDLTLDRTTVADNGGRQGGGLFNYGVATVMRSHFVGNHSGAGGGDGITNTGTLRVLSTTVEQNEADYASGIGNQGTTEIVNSTIADNLGWRFTGGMTSRGVTMVVASTITGNASSDTVGGIVGAFMLKNTLVAGNESWNSSLPPPDCQGLVESLGQNILGDGTGCAGMVDGVNGDLVGVDWTTLVETQKGNNFPGQIIPVLADNDGDTPTVALLPNSSAIDHIAVEACTDAQGNLLTTDQRGVTRPQGAACDIGAFEFSWPRGTGFWEHQCSGLGYVQVSPAAMHELFDQVAAASPAFPECAPVGCYTLRLSTPRNDMRLKAQQSLLALWLNVITGRVTRGRPIDLPALTSATTAAGALAEIEATVCNPDASHGDLATARAIAESINNQGEDMELVSEDSSATIQPGMVRTFTLAVINMSPDVRNFDLAVSGTWPAALSPTQVNGLGPGQIALVSATLLVPGGTASQQGVLQVSASDQNGSPPLSRSVTIQILVSPVDPFSPGPGTIRNRKR